MIYIFFFKKKVKNIQCIFSQVGRWYKVYNFINLYNFNVWKKIVDIFRFKLIKLQDLSIGLNQKFKNQITESKAQVERMEWIK